MDQRSVRVVVGRGNPAGADIRATLEDGGFQVVGEASTVEELARLVQTEPPDVVVLDDAIGVAAAQIVHELAPETKLLVIWPAAVLPVAGATRIDATDLHAGLAPAVAAAAGVLLSGFATIDRPEWIDAVRKDPATLREKLAASGEMPIRPSVTELQRPHGYPAPSTGWRRRSSRSLEPLSAAAAGRGGAVADEDATVNRRLGMIALGGAVAAGALMIALSFGGQTPSVVSAEPFVPGVTAPSNFIPNPAGDATGGGHGASPGGTQSGGGSTGTGTGTGTGAGAGAVSGAGTGAGTGTGAGAVSGTGTGAGTGAVSADGSGTTPIGSDTTPGTTTIASGTTGGGSTGGTLIGMHQSASGPGNGQGGGGQGGGGQGGGGQGGGGQGAGSSTPSAGNSGDRNPHGGPPGLVSDQGGNGGQHPSHPVHPSSRPEHPHKH